jgi:glutaconate CoA-transferase subunit B
VIAATADARATTARDTLARVRSTLAADRLIWRMASEIADGAVVATGVASPLAVLAIALARASHAPGLTYLSCVGSLNPSVSRLFGSSEDLAYLAGRSAEVSIPDLFDHARRGRVDNIFFGAVEVDAEGRTNLSATGSLAHPAVKFPGVAGACSLRRWCRRPVLVVPRQTRRALVPRVAVVSTDDQSRPTRLLTDLGTFSLGGPGPVLEAIAPGATLDDLYARSGFGFALADAFHGLPDVPDHAIETLAALDPAGFRGELVGAAS